MTSCYHFQERKVSWLTDVNKKVSWFGVDILRRSSGRFVALGIVQTVLVVIALYASVFVTVACVVLFGWLLLTGGVVFVVHAFWEKQWSGFFVELAMGILYLDTSPRRSVPASARHAPSFLRRRESWYPCHASYSSVLQQLLENVIVQAYQRFPSVSNLTKGLLVNSDGSVDVYFGPKSPPGKEHNWVQTIPGQTWNTLFGVYGHWSRGSTRPGGLGRSS